MKCLLFFLLALFLTSHAFSQNATMATQPPRVQYNEDQHQYITREAFNLLQNQNGIALPTFLSTLQSHLGTTERRNIPFVGSKVLAGAYDADHNDAVYLYNGANNPTFQPAGFGQMAGLFSISDPFVSVTHFWMSDNGDAEQSQIRGTYDVLGVPTPFYIFNVPNAYQATAALYSDGVKYAFIIPSDISGNNFVFNKESGGTVNVSDLVDAAFGDPWNGMELGLVYLQYNNLWQVYSTKRVYLKWAVDQRYGSFWQQNWTPNWQDVGYVILTDQQRDFVVFDVLGRLCHYLQDMSVPAHAHRDIHGSDDPGIKQDYYEHDYTPAHYSSYNASNVGTFVNPYAYGSTNPLHFLMYTTNQIADWFSSNGPYNIPGDGTFGGNGTSDELAYLSQWQTIAGHNGIPSAGYPGGGAVNASTAPSIFNFCFPQAIKATAGLMLWAAKEITSTNVVNLKNNFNAGVIGVDNLGNVVSGSSGLWQNGTNHSLLSQDQGAKENNDATNPQLWWVHQAWKYGNDAEVTTNPYPLTVGGSTDMLARYASAIVATAQVNYPEGKSGGNIKMTGYDTHQATSFTNFVQLADAQKRVQLTGIPASSSDVFLNWSDGNTQNPRYVTSSPVNLTANYKGVHISNDASAFSNNSARKFVRTGTSTPWYHQVYTSMGHVWIEHSTDGVSWTLGNGGLPLDNGAGKLPSIACNGESVAAVFQEQYGSTWQIVVETFNLTGGSYSKGIRANVWLDTSPYSNNVNPNIAWKTRSDGTGVYVITWERGGINYVYGRLGSLSFYEDTWGQLAGTDANSISTSLSSVRIGQNQDPTWKIAWQQRVGSSYAFIKYAEFAFYYTGTWNFVWAMSPIQISSSSVMNNYQPSMICDASNNWYACWIGDVNGTGDPTSVKVIYTNKAAKSSNVYYMYGMNTMPKSCAINISNTGVGCYFAWSASQPSYSNKFVDVGNTGVIKTLNTSGKDIQMCGGAQTGMSVSAYYPFSTPYYFAKSGNLTTLPKTSPNAVATERGCFIGKGAAHLFYSFGNMLINNTLIDFVDAPDTANYDGLAKINAVMVSQPIQISPTSKFTFTEFSSSADSSSLMSVLADTGYVRYRIDLVDNVTGGVIGTVKNTMLTKANPVEEAGTTYSLDTKNIGTRTVKAKIAISTNLDGPDIALVKSFSESNAVTAASAQSITLQPVTVITDYSLDQNFPNPFNPSTQISYSIPKDRMVMLKIFDALGREVETLVNEAQTVGRYDVTFDGSRLSSGVYFYRLVSGEKVITKKMLMIK